MNNQQQKFIRYFSNFFSFGSANGLPARPIVLFLSVKDRISFTKRLGMILRSGVPILEGLAMINSHVGSRSAAYIYRSIATDVASGHPLSSGLERFRSIFGDFCVNIVRVGEASGVLHQNLEYVATELKKRQTLRRKVISALIYPALIVVATIGIVVLLTAYLFPKIVPIFFSVKAELPVTTKILIAISDFLTAHGVMLLLGIVAMSLGMYVLLMIRALRQVCDRAFLSLPFVGSLSRLYNLANISRTLGILLKSSVDIVSAITLVSGGLTNRAYRRALDEINEQIIAGHNLSSQFARYPALFPPLFAQMIAAAEATGNLSSTLLFLSDTYEEEIDDLAKNLTTILEPALMIAMGIIVGFVAISIISPIYSITQNLDAYR
jgi:type IV pilus assembly protein PilC